MEKSIMERFRKIFEAERDRLNARTTANTEEFRLEQDDLKDEIDLTSSQMDRSLRLRLKNREALYLKKIHQALSRIKDGTFGTCVECEEDIEVRRLEARPSATHCIGCKESQEQREYAFADGRAPKSLGVNSQSIKSA